MNLFHHILFVLNYQIPFQYTLSIHPIDTSYQFTLSLTALSLSTPFLSLSPLLSLFLLHSLPPPPLSILQARVFELSFIASITPSSTTATTATTSATATASATGSSPTNTHMYDTYATTTATTNTDYERRGGGGREEADGWVGGAEGEANRLFEKLSGHVTGTIDGKHYHISCPYLSIHPLICTLSHTHLHSNTSSHPPPHQLTFLSTHCLVHLDTRYAHGLDLHILPSPVFPPPPPLPPP